jgi:hydroxymethylbilane synthase
LADPSVANALASLDDPPTRLATTAERAVLAGLGAGCAAPVGVHAKLVGDQLRLCAVVVSPTGEARLFREDACTLTGPWRASQDLVHDAAGWSAVHDRIPAMLAATSLGLRVAEALLAGGARDIALLGESTGIGDDA